MVVGVVVVWRRLGAARGWPLAGAIVIGTVSISGNHPICMDAVDHALRLRVLKRGKTMVAASTTPPGGSLAPCLFRGFLAQQLAGLRQHIDPPLRPGLPARRREGLV